MARVGSQISGLAQGAAMLTEKDRAEVYELLNKVLCVQAINDADCGRTEVRQHTSL